MLSNIIESLINKNENNLEFNFSKSIKENIQKNYDNNLPIEIEESDYSWQVVNDNEGEKLEKVYTFSSHKHMSYFINEYLSQIRTLHKSPCFAVNKNLVKVTLFTDDLMQVSEQDIELSKFLDDINNDILFIRDL